MLNCGLHKCPSKCHQLYDHSEIRCPEILKRKCSKGHSETWKCSDGAPKACKLCDKDAKDAQEALQKSARENVKRTEKIEKHVHRIAKLQAQIDEVTQSMKDAHLDAEQQAAFEQKRQDLEKMKQSASSPLPNRQHDIQASSDKPSFGSTSGTKATHTSVEVPTRKGKLQEHLKTCKTHNSSPSGIEWQRQKDIEGAKNPAVDAIMKMIGLESVKNQILKIKAKVDTSMRQSTDLTKERFGLVLLGNPGTGAFSSLRPS